MDSKVCKFHPRQMQWKPFLSPPRICRFFAKQMVMWATSPTFGASSLNKWKVGPTFEQYFVQSLRTLKHKFWRRRRQCKALPGNGNAIYTLFECSSFFCNCLECVACHRCLERKKISVTERHQSQCYILDIYTYMCIC